MFLESAAWNAKNLCTCSSDTFFYSADCTWVWWTDEHRCCSSEKEIPLHPAESVPLSLWHQAGRVFSTNTWWLCDHVVCKKQAKTRLTGLAWFYVAVTFRSITALSPTEWFVGSGGSLLEHNQLPVERLQTNFTPPNISKAGSCSDFQAKLRVNTI